MGRRKRIRKVEVQEIKIERKLEIKGRRKDVGRSGKEG